MHRTFGFSRGVQAVTASAHGLPLPVSRVPLPDVVENPREAGRMAVTLERATPSVNTQDASADIRAVIRRINSAWLDGPADAITTALLPCFDESVVFCGSSFQVVARGATACVSS